MNICVLAFDTALCTVHADRLFITAVVLMSPACLLGVARGTPCRNSQARNLFSPLRTLTQSRIDVWPREWWGGDGEEIVEDRTVAGACFWVVSRGAHALSRRFKFCVR